MEIQLLLLITVLNIQNSLYKWDHIIYRPNLSPIKYDSIISEYTPAQPKNPF